MLKFSRKYGYLEDDLRKKNSYCYKNMFINFSSKTKSYYLLQAWDILRVLLELSQKRPYACQETTSSSTKT